MASEVTIKTKHLLIGIPSVLAVVAVGWMFLSGNKLIISFSQDPPASGQVATPSLPTQPTVADGSDNHHRNFRIEFIRSAQKSCLEKSGYYTTSYTEQEKDKLDEYCLCAATETNNLLSDDDINKLTVIILSGGDFKTMVTQKGQIAGQTCFQRLTHR